MVHVEDFALVHAQALDAVLVGVRVDRFLKGLAQDVLAAFGVGDQAVQREHQVVGYQGIGSGEEAEVAFDDQPFVGGEAVGIFPQRDVGVHVDFLRHPVVGAAVEVFLPGPVVFEGHELIQIGAAVDHGFLVDGDAHGSAGEFFGAFTWVQLCYRFDGGGDRVGVHDYADGGGLANRLFCNRLRLRWRSRGQTP